MVTPAAMARLGLRTALRCRPPGTTPASKRPFAATSAHHDDAYEAEKWEKITYAGIATCTILAIYNLLIKKDDHSHYQFVEPPKPYPYLGIRNKDFPWGPDPLIEHIKKKKKKKKKQRH